MSVLKIWNGSAWVQIDTIKGEQGIQGPTGATGADYDPTAYTPVTDDTNLFACDVASASYKNFYFTIANTTAKTVTFSNIPSGRCEVFLEITASETAAVAWTLNGGSTLAWSTGSAPALTATKVYRVMFITSDSGATWDAYPTSGVA